MGSKASQEKEVVGAIRGFQAAMGLTELMVIKVIRAKMAKMDHKAMMDVGFKDLKANEDHAVIAGNAAAEVVEAHKGTQGPKDQKDFKGGKAVVDSKAHNRV